MPNHYTTIAICSPGYEFDCEEFNSKHAETNLCAAVMPMPERIREINFGWAPMADGTYAIQWTESKNERGEVVRAAVEGPSWYEWARENWGTQSGTYDMKAFELGGDGAPVAIKFQSASYAPTILHEIADWLRRVGKFEQVAFVGFDPYDDSTRLLEDDA